MPSLCLYLGVHIPYRLQRFSDNGVDATHTSGLGTNKMVVDQLAIDCYLPVNKILQELIEVHEGKFKIVFSISGTAIELLQTWRPDVFHSFQRLAGTGCVEFMAETYYNSLSWLHSRSEFKRQVQLHHNKIEEVFNLRPNVFRNSELIYCNDLAHFVAGMGYRGILCEGLETILKGRSSNHTYATPGNGDFGVLLRNTRLSDDIAFRFDDASWNEQPLTAEKFAGWVHAHDEKTCNLNLHFDYETFGIHKKRETGIFEFLQKLPGAILANESWLFKTASEVLDGCYPKDIFDAPQVISWQNKSAENCIWSENVMQHNSLHKVYNIEKLVQKSNCVKALDYWGRLQSADHFYLMSEQETANNAASNIGNPFQSAQEAYQQYKSNVTEFELHLIHQGLGSFKSAQRYDGVYNLYAGNY